MSVKLEEKPKEATLRDYGYISRKDFVQDAIRRRLLELKKAEFFAGAAALRKAMRKRKLSESALLKDLERFSRH